MRIAQIFLFQYDFGAIAVSCIETVWKGVEHSEFVIEEQ